MTIILIKDVYIIICLLVTSLIFIIFEHEPVRKIDAVM